MRVVDFLQPVLKSDVKSMKGYIITTGSLFGLLAVVHPFCVSGQCACFAQPLGGTHKGLLPNNRIGREVEDAMQRLHLGKGAA